MNLLSKPTVKLRFLSTLEKLFQFVLLGHKMTRLILSTLYILNIESENKFKEILEAKDSFDEKDFKGNKT